VHDRKGVHRLETHCRRQFTQPERPYVLRSILYTLKETDLAVAKIISFYGTFVLFFW